MGEDFVRIRVPAKKDRVLFLQLSELSRECQGAIDIVAIFYGVAGVDLEVFLFDVT